MYIVTFTEVRAGGIRTAVLDRPLAAGKDTPLPPALASGRDAAVWVCREHRTPGPNQDVQVLLQSMGAHLPVLKLLGLPFTEEEVRPEELYVRQVLQGCYRLLRGMVTKCPAMQVPADVSVLHHYRHKRNHQPLASMPSLSPRPQNSESPSPSERTFSAH